MKPALIVGIILIVIGIISLAAGGITYATEEEILDIGPIEATAETEKVFPLPPVLGVLSLAAGVILVAVGGRAG